LLPSTLLLGQPPERPRGFLGVVINQEQGGDKALVHDVAPDSPAQKAGFKAGDVIKKVGDKEVKSGQDFFQLMSGHKPGDKMTFVVIRDGKDQELSATLGERPGAAGAGAQPPERGGAAPRPPERGSGAPPRQPEFFPRRGGAYLGIRMEPAEKGAKVVDVTPDSPAAKAGLKADDVITGVGDKNVGNPEELQRAIQETGAGKEVTLHVMRGQEKVDIKATLGEPPAGGPFGDLPPRIRERFPNLDTQPFFEGGRRTQDLEKKIEALEKRIAELEKKLEKK
jgi:S1-C subfamily serine protease